MNGNGSGFITQVTYFNNIYKCVDFKNGQLKKLLFITRARSKIRKGAMKSVTMYRTETTGFTGEQAFHNQPDRCQYLA